MIKPETKNKIKTDPKIRLTIVFLSILLIVFMFPRGEAIESDVTVGAIWIQDDLIASMPFEILKDTEIYNREKLAAAEQVYPVFVLNNSVLMEVLDSIKVYNKYLIDLIDSQLKNQSPSKNETFLSDESFQKFKAIRKFENSLSIDFKKSLNEIFRNATTIVVDLYKNNFYDLEYSEIPKDSIALRDGKFENIIPKRRFYDKNIAQENVSNLIKQYLNGDLQLNFALQEYLSHFIKPPLKFSEELTKEAKQLAQDKVSRNLGIVEENERIVAKHDRITKDIKLKIDSYRIAKGEETTYWARFLQNLGKFLHIIVIVSLFSIYIFLFRKKIYNDSSKILLIAIITLFIGFLTYLIYQMNVTAPVELLVLVPVASMLLTIFFDSRVGFYGTITVALIAGGLRGNDYVFTVMNIFAGGLAAYTVRDIKNRNQIFRSFLFILLGYIVSIFAFGLERFASIEQILIQCGFAASNALVSPVLTYGLIIFFEKIFKITTDISLFELTDYNNPLLKELAKNAQGTFNHSMTISNMVESAAAVIGANPLLARVGALYHDIGKSQNPYGFVENQMDSENLHEKLQPEKSASIIIDHVIEGVKLGEKYNLPREIINFIPMHHGTMVVSYFYEKAKELYGEEKVDKNNYRYPGPKPNTKETALVMLADACESTVRAMHEPEPQKIENVINNIVKSRLDDRQLEDAPLTFKDLTKIKISFYNNLLALHHKRIRYPKQDEIENDLGNNDK